ncbi:MAG: class I SAM-dependent methyltransferase [Syntrophaceae bacterium]|nr:class I SAM-dependent methyltransferase [Syntrophaceae bacterium]
MNKKLHFLYFFDTKLRKLFGRIYLFIIKIYCQTRYKIRDKSAEDIFTNIFNKDLWTSSESKSGLGSTNKNTQIIKMELIKIMSKYNVNSILDAPCGDMNWIKGILPHFNEYTGADIVAALIDQNNRKYGSSNVRFIKCDIINSSLPKVDLIISKDYFQHLTTNEINSSIKNFIRSGSKYLLATTFPATDKNLDNYTGGYFPYNLQIPPFNLTKPLSVFSTYNHPDHPHMALWRLDNIL